MRVTKGKVKCFCGSHKISILDVYTGQPGGDPEAVSCLVCFDCGNMRMCTEDNGLLEAFAAQNLPQSDMSEEESKIITLQ